MSWYIFTLFFVFWINLEVASTSNRCLLSQLLLSWIITEDGHDHFHTLEHFSMAPGVRYHKMHTFGAFWDESMHAYMRRGFKRVWEKAPCLKMMLSLSLLSVVCTTS